MVYFGQHRTRIQRHRTSTVTASVLLLLQDARARCRSTCLLAKADGLLEEGSTTV